MLAWQQAPSEISRYLIMDKLIFLSKHTQNILAIIDVILFLRGGGGSFITAGYLLAVMLASWLSIASSARLEAAV